MIRKTRAEIEHIKALPYATGTLWDANGNMCAVGKLFHVVLGGAYASDLLRGPTLYAIASLNDTPCTDRSNHESAFDSAIAFAASTGVLEIIEPDAEYTPEQCDITPTKELANANI